MVAHIFSALSEARRGCKGTGWGGGKGCINGFSKNMYRIEARLKESKTNGCQMHRS